MTTLLLGALGLTLSLAVPGLLAAARWPDRAPAAAVLLWQAVTLAGVLAAVGAVLAGPEELTRAAGSARPVATAALVAAVAVAALIVLRLLVSLIRVSLGSRARRARHRTMVDLLDRAERSRELGVAGLRVLDGAPPLAYCIPGRSPRVVLSGATLEVLDRAQVEAVLAHEQAHLRHHDDVVMESFTALHRAVPAPLRSDAALRTVHLLLEMVADDTARRRHGAEPLRAALTRLTADGADDDLRRRLARLTVPYRRPVALTVAVTVLAVAVLVLPTLVLVVPWLDRAWAGLPAIT